MVTPDENEAKKETENRLNPASGPSGDSRTPDLDTVAGSDGLRNFSTTEYETPIEVRMPDEKVEPRPIPEEQVAQMRVKAERGLQFLRDVYSGKTDFRIESERKIGAELEFPLVDSKTGRPAFVADQVLQDLTNRGETKVVAELGKHNLELNLPPLAPTGGFLGRLHAEITNLVGHVNRQAEKHGASALMCGILPSLQAEDLSLENLFPGKPRYNGLNQTLLAEHGGKFDIELRGGPDRIDLKGQSIMAESLNTSFQLHFQVPYEEYVKFQHIADFIAGPTLAVAVNSPLVVGYRGPKESRVDVWAGSISDKRVHLGGDDWMKDPLEQFDRALTFNPLLETSPADSDVLELISWSKTVYPWNRTTPDVDPIEKTASIRIEGRPLPSGPTAIDAVANAALFFGLMEGMGPALEREGVVLSENVSFQDAKDNFRSAVDHGISGQMTWINGEKLSTQEFLREKLLPIARQGLERLEVNAADIDKYLGVIEQRLEFGLTPADVLVQKERELAVSTPDRSERMNELSRWMIEKSSTHKPAHTWLGDTPPKVDDGEALH